MDGNNNNAMDDSAMMRYLLGKYGLTDLVGMLRSMSANGENPPPGRPHARVPPRAPIVSCV